MSAALTSVHRCSRLLHRPGHIVDRRESSATSRPGDVGEGLKVTCRHYDSSRLRLHDCKQLASPSALRSESVFFYSCSSHAQPQVWVQALLVHSMTIGVGIDPKHSCCSEESFLVRPMGVLAWHNRTCRVLTAVWSAKSSLAALASTAVVMQLFCSLRQSSHSRHFDESHM